MINPKLLKATIEIVEAAEDYVDDEFSVIKGLRLECAVRKYQKLKNELEAKRKEENRKCPFSLDTEEAINPFSVDECTFYEHERLSCKHKMGNLCLSEARQRVIDSKKEKSDDD